MCAGRAAVGAADRGGAGVLAPLLAAHRAPRPEAGEHPADVAAPVQGGCQASRLRAAQVHQGEEVTDSVD